ncbi:MAG: hypothetical protein WDZ41_02500 [Candidatus Babeliales bacterium]
MDQTKASSIIKILFTFFMMILVPVYWQYYGLQNFLWLSDIGLFITLFALWFESSLLISIAVLAVMPVEITWNVDFFLQLLTGYSIFGIAHYMFDPALPLFLKILSLFHLVMPILWIWYLLKWGYHKQSLVFSTILFWIVLLLTYLFSNSHKNINWVFMPEIDNWQWMPSLAWLAILMISVPLLIFWPLHNCLKNFFSQKI